MSPRRVLYIGEAQHEEMRDAFVWLSANTDLVHVRSIDDALKLCSNGMSPTVIILAQPRRHCHSQRDLERLRRLVPLVPLVSLLGSWCEGETRSGHPYLGVERVAWHQWRERLVPLTSEPSRATILPQTATAMEHTLADAKRPLRRGTGLIVIRANSVDAYDALSDVCIAAGYSAVHCPQRGLIAARGVSAAIWDGNECDQLELDAIGRLLSSIGRVPLIALFNFPRRGEADSVLAAGASVVLGKPFAIGDVTAVLERLLVKHAAPASIPRYRAG